MKEARIYVDFNEMLDDDLVSLSDEDTIEDSEGNTINLQEGALVKIYSDDLSSCQQKDNLIAEGIVEAATNIGFLKWNCRINTSGIYNESQEQKE